MSHMGILQSFAVPADPSLLAVGVYDPRLVALSVAISIFASLMALHIAGQAATATSRLVRTVALLSGTLALGAGVWAMHFIGMLAFALCTTVTYDPWITIASMLPSLAASFVALSLIAQPRIGTAKLLSGGVLVGAGIGGMHYTGMTAMQMPLALRYDPSMFALSILVAIGLAVLALWVRFGLRDIGTALTARSRLGISATVMGCAICGMHYTGMAAARFVGHTSGVATQTANADFIALAVALITIALTIGILAANGLLRYRDLVRHLGENESRLGILLATAVDGVITIDADGRIVDFNASAERIFGWLRGEIVGHPVGELMAGPHGAGADAFGRADTDAGRPRTAGGGSERLGLRKDGSTVAIRLAIGHTRLSGLDQFVWFVTDISERKAMEQALRDSEEQFRSLIGNIPGISYRALVAPGLPIVFVSDAIEHFTGHPAGDFRGATPRRRLIEQVHPDDRDLIGGAVARAIEQGRPYLFEYRLLHRDGSTRWMWGNGNVVRDATGRIKWLDGVILDISERRRMEEELRASKERAEQAAAARTAFMANMSHEIRTPMNAILGFTDVLLQSQLPPDQRRYLETVRSSGRALLRLLNEILDSAKLDKGAIELELAEFDLLRLIDELSSTLGASARTKGIALNIQYDKALPHCFSGDELRIRQILTNLLSNAIKFTEAGSVTLSVAALDGQVHFTVSDTGIGIAPDRLEAIFEPFTQADASMSRRFGGTGLGTTISKKLVELMGGRIWAQSAPGQGSSFHVQVPLGAAQQRVHEARRPRGSVALPPLRILVVDDVPQNVELLVLLLDKLGHAVVAAADGALARDAAAREAFDVILMDMQMPGLDGPEASRQIRAAEARSGARRVPIIALTASVLEADRQAARASGMDGFASKPIDLYELTGEIARVLLGNAAADATVPAAPADLQVLDRVGGLRTWAGEQAAYEQALARFARDHEATASTLERLCAAQDLAGARALAHRLKGVAANLGLQRLAAATDSLERCIAGTATHELPDLQARAGGELAGALAAIGTRAPAGAPSAAPAQPTLDIGRVRALGAGLMRSLQRGALDDANLGQLLTLLAGHVDTDRLAQLSRSIDDFDLPAAGAIVGALLASLDAPADALARP